MEDLRYGDALRVLHLLEDASTRYLCEFISDPLNLQDVKLSWAFRDIHIVHLNELIFTYFIYMISFGLFPGL